jgi:RHS repeat-associated protein
MCTALSTVASNIAGQFNSDGTSPVTATTSGTFVYFTAKTVGSGTNYPLTSTTTGVAIVLYNSGSTLVGGANATANDPAVASLATPMVTTYVYDAASRLTQVNQAARGTQTAQTRTYTYDGMDHLITAATPESGTVSYTYLGWDPYSPDTRTDARGVVTTYTLDALLRPSSVAYTTTGTTAVATPTVTYTYGTSAASNNNGRLITAANANESDAYGYDSLGRVTSIGKTIGSNTFTVGYAYNPANELTTLTYPSLRAVTNTYDSIGRVTQLADGVRTYLSSPIYNAAGQTTQFNYGNGVQGCFGYNDHLQVASIRYATGASNCAGGTSLLDLTYSYNQIVGGNTVNNGQLQQVTDNLASVRTMNYSYDAVRRLIQASTTDQTNNGGYNMTLVYDRFGNMTSQSATGPTMSSPYSAPSQPNLAVSATTNRITTSGYTYDAAGNMTGDSVHTYAYDAENRLVTVDSTAASYVYGPAGLRIKKTVGSSITTYVFSGFKVLAEYTGATPALSQEYVYAGGQMLAILDASGTPTYRHLDHLSVRVETNGSAGITNTYGNYPYGESWYNSGTKWRFTTYERDAENNLDYANARSYIPRLGRFLQGDPLAGSIHNPQSLGRYQYVQSDPVNLVDPLGLDSETWTQDGGGIHDQTTVDVNGGDPNIAGAIALEGVAEWQREFLRPLTECEGRANGNISPCGGDDRCPGCSRPHQTARQCADDVAKHWSVAGLTLPEKYDNTFLGGFYNGLAGNTVQGVSSLYDSIANGSDGLASNYGGQLAGNISQGVPLPASASAGAKGPVGVLLDNIAPTAGRILGAGKFVLDGAIYAAAYSFCSTGKY